MNVERETDQYPGFPRGGNFGTIMCDPPWPYRQKFRGGSHLPYETMSEEEIFNLPIGEASAGDAVLLFWTTNAHMALASECVRHYGFEQKTILTWGKVTKAGRPMPGSGFWLRGATEHALLCVKGKPTCPRTRMLAGERMPSFTTLLLTRPRAHSRKPDEVYPLMEAIGRGERLELFARVRREGWSTWGNHPITQTVKLLKNGSLAKATAEWQV